MTEIDRARVAAAAEALLTARRDGAIAELPESCRPRSAAEAYAVQDEIAIRLGGIAGWKVGAPAADATPACAPLPSGTILTTPAQVDAAKHPMRGVEAEIAFRFGEDLPARAEPYDRAAVMAAIETACPAIELCDSRYLDFKKVDPLSHQADSNANAGLVVGADWDGWRDLDAAAQAVRLRIGGETVADHRGGNTAGEPLRLLVWLANHAAARGQPLRKGQIVTTGSWTGLPCAQPGDEVVADFPGIGSVQVLFTG